jgi:hypothetical protein
MSKKDQVVWEDGQQPNDLVPEQPLAASTATDTPGDLVPENSGVIWEDSIPASVQAATSGEQTNDVGNTVIVPKDGEAFADTMKRAAAQGKKTTPEMINKEVGTMPGKVATVLAAAPAIGAAGAAGLAAPGGLPGALEMLETAAKAHPFVAHIITRGIEGLGIGGGISAVKKLLQ